MYEKKAWHVLKFAVISQFCLLCLFWLLRTATAAAASESQNGQIAASGDAYMLAKLISGEARGESYIGQVAVGAVVVNRLLNPNFPNSLSGVVFEPGAFDAVSDGQYHKEPTASAVQAAQSALAGWDPTGGALYYWNPIVATSDWVWSRSIIARIGRHVFAR